MFAFESIVFEDKSITVGCYLFYYHVTTILQPENAHDMHIKHAKDGESNPLQLLVIHLGAHIDHVALLLALFLLFSTPRPIPLYVAHIPHAILAISGQK